MGSIKEEKEAIFCFLLVIIIVFSDQKWNNYKYGSYIYKKNIYLQAKKKLTKIKKIYKLKQKDETTKKKEFLPT